MLRIVDLASPVSHNVSAIETYLERFIDIHDFQGMTKKEVTEMKKMVAGEIKKATAKAARGTIAELEAKPTGKRSSGARSSIGQQSRRAAKSPRPRMMRMRLTMTKGSQSTHKIP